MLNVSHDVAMGTGHGTMPMVTNSNSFANIATKQGRQPSAQLNELNQNQSTMLLYAPDLIVSDQRIYALHEPLSTVVSREEEYVIIENESLGIIATGRNIEEAQQYFAKEFDFIYQRYNELSDDQMTGRIKAIKATVNSIVKAVTLK